MLRQVVGALLMLAAPSGAGAQEAEVLASTWSRSGTVAPAYAWSVNVVIRVDGQITTTHCKGYDTEGPNCTTEIRKVATERLKAIPSEILAQGLIEAPAQKATAFPVGGGTSGATVFVDGATVVLPAFPVEADVPRVAAVLAAIMAATQ